jgi:hypothetical protein
MSHCTREEEKSEDQIALIIVDWENRLLIKQDPFLPKWLRDLHQISDKIGINYDEETGRFEAICSCCFKHMFIDNGSFTYKFNAREFMTHLEAHAAVPRSIIKGRAPY